MLKFVNPPGRKPEVFDTKANYDEVSPTSICDCICNVALDNKSGAQWTSRLTVGIVCGCNCDSTITDNKSSNKAKASSA